MRFLERKNLKTLMGFQCQWVPVSLQTYNFSMGIRNEYALECRTLPATSCMHDSCTCMGVDTVFNVRGLDDHCTQSARKFSALLLKMS